MMFIGIFVPSFDVANSRTTSTSLLNRGGATAEEVLRVAQEMKRRVQQTAGITLEEEVMVVLDPPAPGAA